MLFRKNYTCEQDLATAEVSFIIGYLLFYSKFNQEMYSLSENICYNTNYHNYAYNILELRFFFPRFSDMMQIS